MCFRIHIPTPTVSLAMLPEDRGSEKGVRDCDGEEDGFVGRERGAGR